MAVHDISRHFSSVSIGTTSGGGYGGTGITWTTEPATITAAPIPTTIPTTKPASPQIGSLWLDLATDTVYVFKKSGWVAITTEAPTPPTPAPLDPDRPMDVELD